MNRELFALLLVVFFAMLEQLVANGFDIIGK